jgi:phosphoglycolate phosphatase-like HAD superfamily hydrolase
VTVRLDGIDLVVFDKDGTILDFGRMWASWAEDLAARLRPGTGLAIETALFAMLGYDPQARIVRPGGGLAATPMARLRERTADVLVGAGLSRAEAERALGTAWHAPDPVALAHPLADLPTLFGRLHESGKRVAIATTDDREPTERTLAALGLAGAVDGLVCADDGVAVKPAPDMVLHLCAITDRAPARTAVIGDSPADLRMARAARAGLAIGVLTGVGRREDLEPLADVVLGSVGALVSPADDSD